MVRRRLPVLGKFILAVSEAFACISANTCCGASLAVSARSFIWYFNRTTSYFVSDGGLICSFSVFTSSSQHIFKQSQIICRILFEILKHTRHRSAYAAFSVILLTPSYLHTNSKQESNFFQKLKYLMELNVDLLITQ